MFDHDGRTSAAVLLKVYRFFRDHPDGIVKTNQWPDTEWGAEKFRAWFMGCLNAKINRGDTRNWRCLSDDYRRDLLWDCDRVREYFRDRIRHSGCRGLLRTREMQRRYPQINCQPDDDW